MKDRFLSTLGICRKAGKLLWGFDVVARAAADGDAVLVLLARDLSPKSEKEIRFTLEKHGIGIRNTPVTMDEIWYRVGKRSGILAVTDPGLAHTIEQALIRMNEED